MSPLLEESAAPAPSDAGQTSARRRAIALACASAALGVVLWGGYGRHWSWTGINGHTATMWDWLHLLLLPVVIGLLPIMLSRRARLTRRHRSAALGSMMVFAILVLAGYLVPMAWTGFVGNRLWDWLELLALPLAVALTPIIPELRDRWTRRHTAIALSGFAVFGAFVLGGYVGNWKWTGFRGNTLWDWLHLLLLPLLLPMIVVPALTRRASAAMIDVEDGEDTEVSEEESWQD
jgi:uncharacterized membrane protein